MSGDYLWDKQGQPDTLARELESTLGSLPWSDAPPARRTVPAPRVPVWRRPAIRAGVAFAAIAMIAGAGIWMTRPSATPWTALTLTGTPTLEGRELARERSWRNDQWIETDASSRVALTGDRVGRVTVEPGSRVRLARADADQHRVELERGSISAFIYAPPKLFVVDTPHAAAVDMGCAYTLSVGDDGSALLKVTGGWVELQGTHRLARVPAGAICRTYPATGGAGVDPGPGIPMFADTSPGVASAIEAIERGSLDSLAVLLDACRPRDSLTLWHVLGRVEGEARRSVVDRLITLVAPDGSLDPGPVLAGESGAIDRLWEACRRVW